ncbi:LppU/SCO3897 family protein [Streptomyces chryseus]
MSTPPSYQQPYGQPQQPAPQGPNRPRQGNVLQLLLTMVIFLAIVGGVGYWVYDYNTNPNGGHAKKEAANVAQRQEDRKHEPEVGDCVKVQDPRASRFRRSSTADQRRPSTRQARSCPARA